MMPWTAFKMWFNNWLEWALAERERNMLKFELLAISQETGAYFYRRLADRQIGLVQSPFMDPGTPLHFRTQAYRYCLKTDRAFIAFGAGEYQFSNLEALMTKVKRIYAKMDRLAS